ncbi:phosphatidylinositol 3,4,5-trisphosphate 3-phosphatase and dual-specificity protein phosphatase PTEN-like isoform X2 [Ornithodoros turicata]|uniref:phosphatidylinositol 3,4,5-trisphosphate 3-phosphatase and dual-specificity protein phosphatase PTEN-like isoform X2 n=1 Tax=Ornithodoros turicata TaxID=34597 RepID=UPI0031395281
MTMTARLKQVVSKNKKRYQDEEFDLDLSYIEDNIIAMGYPAEKLEGVFRNHMEDVQRFLETKHNGHYKIYNLCSERQYDAKKFENRVASYPFQDHNPPHIDLMKRFCKDVERWLSGDPKNVAAIHCKAGKGRTGVMICAYLLHSKVCSTAADALSHYSEQRTKDQKGVTIPSQRRYVEYYEELVKSQAVYGPVNLVFTSLEMEPTPTFNDPFFMLYSSGSKMNKVYTSPVLEVRKNCRLHFALPSGGILVQGDIKVEVYTKPKMMAKEKMFQFWFNTFFVPHARKNVSQSNGVAGGELRVHNGDDEVRTLVLFKDDLDKAYKDKQHNKFSKDFKVSLHFTPATNLHPSSQVSGAVGGAGDDPSSDVDGVGTESDTTDDDDWESTTHV